MAGRKIKRLSDAGIRSLTKPGRYSDGDQLWLQVSKWNTKSWLFQYTARGSDRVRQMGLGPYPSVSLAEARAAAVEARRLVRDGNDPIEVRRVDASRKAADHVRMLTFEQCATEFLKKREVEWTNPKHRAQWHSTLATYAYPTLGHLLVRDISEVHVLAVVEPLWHSKNETANRVRGRIANVLDYAKHRKLRTGDNPASWENLVHALPKPSAVKAVSHQRAMPYHDIPEFMRALRQREGTAARALEWLILTATRTGATIGANWSEIKEVVTGPNIRRLVWEVDPSRPGIKLPGGQNAKPPRVALSKRAVAILNSLPRSESSNFLFPGMLPGRHLSDMAMLELLKDMIPHPDAQSKPRYVVHGFRSSFKDWGSELTDYPSEVSEAALWHAVADKVEAAYRRGDLFEKRLRMMEDWSRYCHGEATENIIDLRSGNSG